MCNPGFFLLYHLFKNQRRNGNGDKKKPSPVLYFFIFFWSGSCCRECGINQGMSIVRDLW